MNDIDEKRLARVAKAEVRRGGLYCTHSDALVSGFCPDCEQDVNLMEWKRACERFEAESPEVAEKSPDECSICRGRHGSEVTHACE